MSEWIKCSERLPEMREIYKGSPLTTGMVLTFNGYFVSVGLIEEDVTHWQPLPDPPEAD